MTVIVFGVPPAPTPKPIGPFGRLRLEWTGWDGTTWDLTNPRSGLFVTQDGIKGLHEPAWEQFTQQTVEGQIVDDVRALAREMEFTVYLYSDKSSADWANRYDAFFSSWHPQHPGTLKVAAPTGASRAIDLRLTSDGGETFTRDPYRFTRRKHLLSAVADFPFYRGDRIRRHWGSAAELVEFFDPAGSPPFHISSGRTVADADLTNPGDQDAWIVWTVTNTAGTDLSITIGIGDGTVTLPPVPAGKSVQVDTHPESGAAWEGFWTGSLASGTFTPETDVSGGVDPWDPRPIPPGRGIPVDFDMVGSGVVTADFTPLYRRGLP